MSNKQNKLQAYQYSNLLPTKHLKKLDQNNKNSTNYSTYAERVHAGAKMFSGSLEAEDFNTYKWGLFDYAGGIVRYPLAKAIVWCLKRINDTKASGGIKFLATVGMVLTGILYTPLLLAKGLFYLVGVSASAIPAAIVHNRKMKQKNMKGFKKLSKMKSLTEGDIKTLNSLELHDKDNKTLGSALKKANTNLSTLVVNLEVKPNRKNKLSLNVYLDSTDKSAKDPKQSNIQFSAQEDDHKCFKQLGYEVNIASLTVNKENYDNIKKSSDVLEKLRINKKIKSNYAGSITEVYNVVQSFNQLDSKKLNEIFDNILTENAFKKIQKNGDEFAYFRAPIQKAVDSISKQIVNKLTNKIMNKLYDKSDEDIRKQMENKKGIINKSQNNDKQKVQFKQDNTTSLENTESQIIDGNIKEEINIQIIKAQQEARKKIKSLRYKDINNKIYNLDDMIYGEREIVVENTSLDLPKLPLELKEIMESYGKPSTQYSSYKSINYDAFKKLAIFLCNVSNKSDDINDLLKDNDFSKIAFDGLLTFINKILTCEFAIEQINNPETIEDSLVSNIKLQKESEVKDTINYGSNTRTFSLNNPNTVIFSNKEQNILAKKIPEKPQKSKSHNQLKSKDTKFKSRGSKNNLGPTKQLKKKRRNTI